MNSKYFYSAVADVEIPYNVMGWQDKMKTGNFVWFYDYPGVFLVVDCSETPESSSRAAGCKAINGEFMVRLRKVN